MVSLAISNCWPNICELRQESRKAVAYDIRYDDVGMNLLTSQGFLHACYQAARLEIGSGSLAAPVCSSFVYLHPDLKLVRFRLVSHSVDW